MEGEEETHVKVGARVPRLCLLGFNCAKFSGLVNDADSSAASANIDTKIVACGGHVARDGGEGEEGIAEEHQRERCSDDEETEAGERGEQEHGSKKSTIESTVGRSSRSLKATFRRAEKKKNDSWHRRQQKSFVATELYSQKEMSTQQAILAWALVAMAVGSPLPALDHF